MSNQLMLAAQEVQKCQFIFKDNRTIEVQNAYIFWVVHLKAILLL